MPYHHLTTEERSVIAHMSVSGFSLEETGQEMETSFSYSMT